MYYRGGACLPEHRQAEGAEGEFLIKKSSELCDLRASAVK